MFISLYRMALILELQVSHQNVGILSIVTERPKFFLYSQEDGDFFGGDGVFGKPSNAEVYVFGISHVEFGTRGIRREYSLYDEVAIWKQILLKENN